jgi:hypothetical protein
MAFTIRAGMTFTTPAGSISSTTAEYSTDALAEYDIVVPANSTNLAVGAAFPYANLKALCISGTAAATIKTNDSGSPDDTISLTSTILAKVFTHDGKAGNVTTNPLTADVTALYITSTAAQTIKVRAAYDATP